MADITRKSWGLDAAGNFALISFLLISTPFSAQADQVILDDLIVDGSACIGQDCVNGESFGFDTIRLKENNLRIRAVDTSSTSSFPSRDWQITFNDSANGGANKFSIDDIDGGRTPFTLEAGAPSHSLYVDDGGRVGFGTSTPVVDLHVKSGNTPTLRLEQDSSSGFTAQTWDVAGNEANFFVRDATNGSTLPFRIYPSAPSSALVIEGSTGDIGIGTTTPSGNLHIRKSSDVTFILDSVGTAKALWTIKNKDATGKLNFSVSANGSSQTIPLKIDDLAANNLLKIGIDGDTDMVEINGDLNVTGAIVATTVNGTPDFVFKPGYRLPKIEEHAQKMWQNSHLPALQPAKTNSEGKAIVDLVRRSQNMLEELEIAHIYISQLHKEIQELKARQE